MPDFAESYLGRLRTVVGDRLLLVPGGRIVIENRSGEVLLQHRTDFRVWGLPGGVPEEGESLEATVVREVAEETGLQVRNVRPFGFSSNPQLETIVFPNGHRCQYFSMLFYTREFDGSPAALDDEGSKVAWFSPVDLPEMLANMNATIGAFQRYRETGEFVML